MTTELTQEEIESKSFFKQQESPNTNFASKKKNKKKIAVIILIISLFVGLSFVLLQSINDNAINHNVNRVLNPRPTITKQYISKLEPTSNMFVSNPLDKNDELVFATSSGITASDKHLRNKRILISTKQPISELNAINWSPDGDKFTFYINLSSGDKNNGIYLYDGTSGDIYLLSHSYEAFSGKWSPRGELFAFIDRKTFEDNGDVSIYDSKNNEIKIVPNLTDYRKTGINWDDNNFIYTNIFSHGASSTTYIKNIVKINSTTNEMSEVLPGKAPFDTNASSFQVDYLRMQIFYNGVNQEVDTAFRFNLQTQKTDMIGESHHLTDLHYSPDGKSAIFYALGEGGSLVYEVNPITLEEKNLNTSVLGIVNFLNWYSDDNILVQKQNEVWLMDINNLAVTKFMDASVFDIAIRQKTNN